MDTENFKSELGNAHGFSNIKKRESRPGKQLLPSELSVQRFAP